MNAIQPKVGVVERIKRHKLSLWVWWVGFTIAYLPLFILSGAIGGSSIIGYIAATVGLFVPLGFGSVLVPIYSLHDVSPPYALCKPPDCYPPYQQGYPFLALFAIPVVLAGLFFAEKLAKHLRFLQGSPVKKIFFNLVVLFVLTFLADLLIYKGLWTSLFFFKRGGDTHII